MRVEFSLRDIERDLDMIVKDKAFLVASGDFLKVTKAKGISKEAKEATKEALKREFLRRYVISGENAYRQSHGRKIYESQILPKIEAIYK